MKYAIIVIATVATLVVMLTAPSLEAARSSGRLVGITIGGRFESGDMTQGLTGSFFTERRLTRSLLVFGVFDFHRIVHQKTIREYHRTKDIGKTYSSGVGANLGFKLCIPGRSSPVSLSPGVAIGFLARPNGAYGTGNFGSARFSLELAFLGRKRAGFIVEASSLAIISGGESGRDNNVKPMVSIRAGIIWRLR